MPINRKNYPPDWDKIRARILKRAEYKCEHCGIKRYTVYLIESGKRIPIIVGDTFAAAKALRIQISETMSRTIKVVRLTTAHINHDEWNHDVTDDELACLCEKCHFAHDQEDNQRRKKYGKQYKRHQMEMF